jgi:hypothetical protein
MDEESYFNLLDMITPMIKKQDTMMRQSITPHERLTATPRFLASGCTYEELKYPTAISPQSLGHIIPETCKAIIACLLEYMNYAETMFTARWCMTEWYMFGPRFHHTRDEWRDGSISLHVVFPTHYQLA